MLAIGMVGNTSFDFKNKTTEIHFEALVQKRLVRTLPVIQYLTQDVKLISEKYPY